MPDGAREIYEFGPFRLDLRERRLLRDGKPVQLRAKVFDTLRMTVKLGPGDMLVVMSLPNSGSRLGHYFHTVDSADGPQQKLILIRLADVPQGDTFAGLGE